MSPTRAILPLTAGVLCSLVFAWGATISAPPASPQETAEPAWIRDDIEAGYARALATGKPLLVAFR